MQSKNISEQVKQAILSGKETKLTRALRRDPWQDIRQGVQFVEALNAACDALYKEPRTNQSQRALRDLYIERVRTTSLRLIPQQLLEVCKEMMRTGTISILASLVFGTPRDHMEEGVKIMELITGARRLFPPFTDLDDNEDWGDEICGLGIIFGLLIELSRQHATFTWDNFLEASIQRDPRAMSIWDTIVIGHATLHGFAWSKDSEIEKLIDPVRNSGTTIHRETLIEVNKYLNGDMEECVPLPIPDYLYDRISPVLEEFVGGVEQEQEKIVALVDWYRKNRESILFLQQSMWEDICQRPRFGLRTNGDRVTLDFPPLQAERFNHQSFVLRPLNPFPNAEVKFWLRYMRNPMSRTFTFAPNYFSWQQDDHWQLMKEEMRIVDEILHFIALHSYWTIVMGRSEPGKPLDTADVAGEAERNRTRFRAKPDNVSVVRPHFRRLPEGWQASEVALQEAQQALGITELPSGRTFVREHERGWGQMEEMPPVFTYTEADLKSWV